MNEQENLTEKLLAYHRSGMLPMHMPGHKQNSTLLSLGEPCLLDITEIDGFDNLHQAEGLLRTAMERAAALWGALSTRYLVNGSTAGLLTALSALCPKGSTVIVARNCHLSVWHAIELRELKPVCILPPTDPATGVMGSVTPEMLEDAFIRAPDACAVVVTSPTYEGVVSDIARLSRVAHDRGAWLIVDEAHGAHLGFSGDFPESAVRIGGDAVIQSLHKTLPALTQTALLHIGSARVPDGLIAHYSGVYQTSSPSYLLMASMDSCIGLLEAHADELFGAYGGRLERFYGALSSMKKLRLIGGVGRTPAARTGGRKGGAVDAAGRAESAANAKYAGQAATTGHTAHTAHTAHAEHAEHAEYAEHAERAANTEHAGGAEHAPRAGIAQPRTAPFFDRDPGKLYISTLGSGMTGRQLYDRLRTEFKIQPEMATAAGCLCMSSVADTEEGFRRLAKALLEIDKRLTEADGRRLTDTELPLIRVKDRPLQIELPERVCTPAEAVERETVLVPLNRAAGRISAEFVYAYPPDIPLLVPGERISGELIKAFDALSAAGVRLQASSMAKADGKEMWLKVLRL